MGTQNKIRDLIDRVKKIAEYVLIITAYLFFIISVTTKDVNFIIIGVTILVIWAFVEALLTWLWCKVGDVFLEEYLNRLDKN